MDARHIPWKVEWKAAGLDPGLLTPEQEALAEQLRGENETFLRRHPRRKARAVSGLWSLVPLAAAALALIALVPWGQASAPAGERIKGSGAPVLTVYRQGTAGPEKLAARAVVRPGDLLQAAYQVSAPVQGALVSVDGEGNVTVHLAQGGRSVALTAGVERRLDFSYELDRAPRYEVFLLLTSSKPFDLEGVRRLLKQQAWDTLKPGAFGPAITFAVLPLTKEVTP